jgi:O-antigen biosynthesis protein WbqV
MKHPFRPLWSHKNAIAITHDGTMAAISYVLALYLRLGGNQYGQINGLLWPGMALFVLVCVGVFFLNKQYRGMWRYASMQDVITICKSATLAVLIFLPLLFFITRLDGYPRSALVINWLLLAALLAGPRLLYRLLRERNIAMILGDRWSWLFPPDSRTPVLLLGMDDNAELFLRGTQRAECAPYKVVAIVDDDPRLRGRIIHGVRVLGSFVHLEKILGKLNKKGTPVQQLILSLPYLEPDRLRGTLAIAEKHGLSMARLPDLDHLQNAVEKTKLRPIAIEELLGRAQIPIAWDNIRALINGRRVLVTGAGGSIGSELARSIASVEPACLMLLDHSELNLYTIDQDIAAKHPQVQRISLLADVRDGPTIHHLMQQHEPELIFHAAAIKHVPIAEQNPFEAVMTNIVGTRNVADAARDTGALAMVMISTDKAVNPTSLMGATKRAAELYCQALGEEASTKQPTRFMNVRFGNVLGSTGSVVPLFKKQLEAGGPITITDPGMVRYFMTIQEAVHLVLQASVAGMDPAHKSGQIFVLDMGEPVRIMELAEKMIRLSGLIPGKDIAIRTIGIRPGEKLYEELFYPEEAPERTGFHGIFLARPRPLAGRAARRHADALERLAASHDLPKMLQALQLLVEEYNPEELVHNHAA